MRGSIIGSTRLKGTFKCTRVSKGHPAATGKAEAYLSEADIRTIREKILNIMTGCVAFDIIA